MHTGELRKFQNKQQLGRVSCLLAYFVYPLDGVYFGVGVDDALQLDGLSLPDAAPRALVARHVKRHRGGVCKRAETTTMLYTDWENT